MKIRSLKTKKIEFLLLCIIFIVVVFLSANNLVNYSIGVEFESLDDLGSDCSFICFLHSMTANFMFWYFYPLVLLFRISITFLIIYILIHVFCISATSYEFRNQIVKFISKTLITSYVIVFGLLIIFNYSHINMLFFLAIIFFLIPTYLLCYFYIKYVVNEKYEYMSN